MNKGILHLALRSPADDHDAKTTPATMNDIEFHQEKPTNWAANACLTLLAAASARSAPESTATEKPGAAPRPKFNNPSIRKFAPCEAWSPARCGLPLRP